MNPLTDLLSRYAAHDQLCVDAREWLLLLELDPIRAADTMRQLAILAAEDTIIATTNIALDALHAGRQRGDTSRPANEADAAAASLHRLSDAVAGARQRAAAIWTGQLVPDLVQACVLTPAPAPLAEPRRWTHTVVGLPGCDTRYPAQIAAGRSRTATPTTRVQLATCARIADDLANDAPWQPERPLVVMDADRPAHVLGTSDLETAWARDSCVAVADPAGWVTFAPSWPWRSHATNLRPHTTTRTAHARNRPTAAPTQPA
jgi:hypothetical protein